MKRLEKRAYRDTLTGLLNRTAYYEYNQTLDRQIASGEASFSVLMVDVNYLKRMNDTHGHEKGNEFLKNAAILIARVFGQERLYRTGGDEFVGVFEGGEQDAVQQKIREFKNEIARPQSQPGLQPWERVSAAVGIAAYDSARDKRAEDVLKRADAAMYQDKLAIPSRSAWSEWIEITTTPTQCSTLASRSARCERIEIHTSYFRLSSAAQQGRGKLFPLPCCVVDGGYREKHEIGESGEGKSCQGQIRNQPSA